MNMISTGSFLTETGASNKQSELVKKLTAAWEKKNSKTARAGGASLMALSLAACGGEDNTPFSQADVDAAKAEGVASVDITSDNTDVMLAQADYDAAIEAAKTSNDADIAAAAKTEALTAANGTIYATVDAAYTAGSNLSNADAVTAALTGADGTVYATVDAAVTAGADGVDITTDNAAAIAAELDGTGFASVAALNAAYVAATSPAAASYALTASTTAPDAYTGGTGVDTLTATSSTYQTSDILIGGEGNDSLTINATGAVSAATLVSGIETVTVNMSSFAAAAINMDNVKGYTTLTINNTQSGGLADVNLDNVETGGTVVMGAGVTGDVNIDADGAATFDIGSATGLVMDLNNVTTASTITANSVTGGTGITTGNADIEVVNIDDASISSTSAAYIIVDGDTDTTDAVSISAANASATTKVALETALAQQVEILTLSGNGGAATYDLDSTGDAPESITFTGDYDVKIELTSAQISTETAVDNTSAGATGTVLIDTASAATADLGNVTSAIELKHTTAQAIVYDTVNNATVSITADAGAKVTLSSDALTTGAETLNLTLGSSQTNAATDTSDFETVNLVVDDGAATTGTITVNDLNASGATGAKVVVTGADNLTLSGADATEIDGSDMTGKLTATIASDLKKISSGSANDIFTIADVDMTINGGDGTDTFNLASGDLDLSNNTISITNMEVINLDTGGGASDDTLTMLGSQITGQSWVITGTDNANTAGNNDVLVVKTDATITDLGSLTMDADDMQVTIDVTSTAAIAMNITGTNAADTLSNAGAGAINISGGAGDDVITTGTGDDTIDGGSGADQINGGTGADQIIAGEGADQITTSAGADTVDLTETTAVEDIIIQGNKANVTVTGFDTGSESTADEVTLSIAAIEGLASVTDLVNTDGVTVATTTAASVSAAFETLTAAATIGAASGKTAIVIDGDIADTDALETALEVGGDYQVTATNAFGIGDALLVIYDDGTHSYLASVASTAGTATTFAAADLTAVNIMTFSGIADATDIVAGNFNNIVA